MESIMRAGPSRLESGLIGQSFDIIALIDDFRTWYSRTLPNRDQQLTAQISAEIPRCFRGNQFLVKHLFFATGKNSLLYVGAGMALLEVKAEQLGGSCYIISFTLTLSGKGMPLNKEKELFRSTVIDPEGDDFSLRCTNLYYARMIARRFGGDIRILNDVGFGTRYRIEIHLSNIPF